MVGASLVSTQYPPVSVTVQPPLLARGHGREWASLRTPSLTATPLASFDYAVYSDTGEGLVTRHAHTIILRPSNTESWVFAPESQGVFGALSYRQTGMNGMTVTEQILPVAATSDWFSALWLANGRETPRRGLARRFSATPERAVRLVAEYREPWPECLPEDAASLSLVPGSCLEGFLSRSSGLFTFTPGVADASAIDNTASGLTAPNFPPDTRKLAGELREASDLFLNRHLW
jgi:hypothetical protein